MKYGVMQTFILDPEAVTTDAYVADKDHLMEFLAEKFSQCYGLDRDKCHDRLEERERLGSTGFGRGIAIPHGKIAGIDVPVAVAVHIAKPLDFGSVDSLPVDLVIAFLSPQHGGSIHLQVLATISRMMRNDELVARLRGAHDGDAAYAILANAIDRNAA